MSEKKTIPLHKRHISHQTYTTTHYTLVAIRYIFLKLSSFQNIFVNLASIVHDFVLVPSHLGM